MKHNWIYPPAAGGLPVSKRALIAHARAEIARAEASGEPFDDPFSLPPLGVGVRVRVTQGSDRPFTGRITHDLGGGSWGVRIEEGQGTATFAITLWGDRVEVIEEEVRSEQR